MFRYIHDYLEHNGTYICATQHVLSVAAKLAFSFAAIAWIGSERPPPGLPVRGHLSGEGDELVSFFGSDFDGSAVMQFFHVFSFGNCEGDQQ